MHHPRVVVFGYGELGRVALDTLARLDVAPVAVVLPGNRRGHDVESVAADARARGHRLLTQPPRSAIAPFLADVRGLQPDLLLVWSYSMILPQALIDVPRLGAVNVHGGLLPEYRGGHVLNWALINGETETGVTLHYIDAGIDTGPVIAQQRFPIAANDDAASVQRKLETTGQELLGSWWPSIADGTAPRTPQDESRARYHAMRTADDGRIDWTGSSTAIANLVRALVAPWPGAFTFLADAKLVVRRVEPVDVGNPAAEAGTVTRVDDNDVRVATGSGALRLLSVEIDGQAMRPADLRRAGIAEGTRFEAHP
jgi:methionyl-tRNA formyltransferase